MEKRKTSCQKAKRKKAVTFIALAVLVSVSVWITLLPNGWKQVYAFFGLTEFGDRVEAYPFAMHVLDVGKADAILVTCGDHHMLVDCGMEDDGAQITAYLQKRGVSHLDYAVNTHPDSDHIGGYPTVLRQISANVFVEPVIASALLENNEDYQMVTEVLNQRQILRKSLSAGDTFSFGQALVEVLSPATEMDSTNNSSLVLRITYGETTFLLMGDAEAEAEEQLLAGGAELRSDVLKVGHHGSKTSTTEAFLDAVSPTYGAISVGEDRNNLPKDEILQRLQAHQVDTYRTDLDGVLLFGSDGHTITVMTENDTGD